MGITTKDFRIYVACLAAYNSGRLHGEWIDLDGLDADDVNERIQAMLKNSPEPDAEEFAIHDYELPFEIGEYTGIDEIFETLNPIIEHGDEWLAYVDLVGRNYADAKDFENRRFGIYKDAEEFAYEYAENCMEIPEHLKYYIDYEKLQRDLLMDGFDGVEYNGLFYVFTNG